MASLVSTPITNPYTNDEPCASAMKRWQTLFDYSPTQALTRIKAHRASDARKLIPDKHWNTVASRMQEAGYDRETYEHALLLHSKKKPVATLPITANDAGLHAPSSSTPIFYLFKLGDAHNGQPLLTASSVQTAANLPIAPKALNLAENGKEVQYCRVDAAAKEHIGQYLLNFGVSASISHSRFMPCSMARKDLCDWSAYPTLGLDTTLPQHRSRTSTEKYVPRQREYPVWYFLYGTLGDAGKLGQIMGLDEVPILHPARISGGVIKEWEGRYKALVDGPESALVKGWAYLVKTLEQEDELRFYETAGYEVVRCGILMEIEGGSKRFVQGCTFRFVDAARLGQD